MREREIDSEVERGERTGRSQRDERIKQNEMRE